jgi:hypothetical protein
MQAKEDAKEEEEVKKRSKEDDSVLTDGETDSNSEYPGESGEVRQGTLNSTGGLLSRVFGLPANITDSTSRCLQFSKVFCLEFSKRRVKEKLSLYGYCDASWAVREMIPQSLVLLDPLAVYNKVIYHCFIYC